MSNFSIFRVYAINRYYRREAECTDKDTNTTIQPARQQSAS